MTRLTRLSHPRVPRWPSWPGNTQPTTLEGWKAALLAKHTFALAGFLIMAGDRVYMQYEVRMDDRASYTNRRQSCHCAHLTSAGLVQWPDTGGSPVPSRPIVMCGTQRLDVVPRPL